MQLIAIIDRWVNKE